MRPWRPAAAPPPAGAPASAQLQTAHRGPQEGRSGSPAMPVPRHPPSFRRPRRGHGAPHGGLQQPSPAPGKKVSAECRNTAGHHSCKIFSPYRACKAKTDRICSRPLRYTGAKAGPWHPAAPPQPRRFPGRSQRLPCLLCPNWTRAQLYKLVSVDLPAVFVGS